MDTKSLMEKLDFTVFQIMYIMIYTWTHLIHNGYYINYLIISNYIKSIKTFDSVVMAPYGSIQVGSNLFPGIYLK